MCMQGAGVGATMFGSGGMAASTIVILRQVNFASSIAYVASRVVCRFPESTPVPALIACSG